MSFWPTVSSIPVTRVDLARTDHGSWEDSRSRKFGPSCVASEGNLMGRT